jgi:hypothetical protein
MTNDKQQTAVEWFLIECGKYGDTAQIPDEVIDEAKEMEKDQHIKSWETGLMKVDFNEYYNETYEENQ